MIQTEIVQNRMLQNAMIKKCEMKNKLIGELFPDLKKPLNSIEWPYFLLNFLCNKNFQKFRKCFFEISKSSTFLIWTKDTKIETFLSILKEEKYFFELEQFKNSLNLILN